MPALERVLSIGLLVLAGGAAFAQTVAPGDVERRMNEHLARAAEAYKTRDYKGFLDGYREASALSPENPNLLYRVARGYALVGNADAAVEILGRLAAMHLVYPIADHPDLVPLRDHPGFRAAVARMARNGDPKGASEVAFTFPEDDLLIEGLAHDAKTDRFFVSSVHRRKIMVIDKKGVRADFVSEGRDGLLGALGMHADATRRALWVCSAALPPVAGVPPDQQGKTAVLRYHLDTGALEKRYTLPDASGRHSLGDLTLTADGDVLVSDSVSGTLYTIPRKTDELEVFLPAGTLRSPQGLTLNASGTTIFVADYTAGIFAIDRATRTVSRVSLPADAPAYGIDGLIYHRGTLIALQNGVSPQRVVRLFLGPAEPVVVVAELLSLNDPSLLEPTLGVMVGDDFHYVATSQWANFDDSGALRPAAERRPAVIARMRLSP